MLTWATSTPPLYAGEKEKNKNNERAALAFTTVRLFDDSNEVDVNFERKITQAKFPSREPAQHTCSHLPWFGQVFCILSPGRGEISPVLISMVHGKEPILPASSPIGHRPRCHPSKPPYKAIKPHSLAGDNRVDRISPINSSNAWCQKRNILIDNMFLIIKNRPLVASHVAALHHCGILLLEALVQPGGALEVLVDTAHDASLLAVDEGLSGEVVDTIIEAALDHLGVHLKGRLDHEHGRRQVVDGKDPASRAGGNEREVGYSMRKPGDTYSHKLLHLLPLHAGGEFALFRCVKSVIWVLAGFSENDPEE
jgi:hypothetical protein